MQELASNPPADPLSVSRSAPKNTHKSERKKKGGGNKEEKVWVTPDLAFPWGPPHMYVCTYVCVYVCRYVCRYAGGGGMYVVERMGLPTEYWGPGRGGD